MNDKIKNLIIVIEALVILALVGFLFAKIAKEKDISFDQEIEKKWLIQQKDIPYDLSKADVYEIEQTYISFSPEIRVRKINNEQFVLTIKCDTPLKGFVREEHEWTITEEEYNEIVKKGEGKTINKTRYRIKDDEGIWHEIDIFKGEFSGLAYMEIEFASTEEATKYGEPDWVVKDVTTDLLYKNGHLARFGIPESYYEYINENK